MPRPPVDFAATTASLLAHVADLPPEAATPLAHYKRASADAWNLVRYVERNVSRTPFYPASFARHTTRLNLMCLASVVSAFERLLKELAAVCVDELKDYVLDGRFDVYSVKGGAAVSHFAEGSVGRALCESYTWLSCDDINVRFRKLLARPDDKDPFHAFPSFNQGPQSERRRLPIMATVFQIRHTVVHNLGTLTHSDAAKLRILLKAPVQAHKVLAPTRDDLRHLKRFLDETARSLNDRVGQRLAELLTALQADFGFEPQDKANALSGRFGRVLTVDGAAGVLPPA